MKALVQWQITDERNIVMPWFTHPFLAQLKTWDLSDKVILEYGGGFSTYWWSSLAKEVWTIDTNEEWLKDISEQFMGMDGTNTKLFYRKATDGDPNAIADYIAFPDGCKPDIIVVDGIDRFECLRYAIEYLMGKGGIIIYDNWKQDGFICPACEEIVKPFEQYVFPQPDHTDHHGNCWKTAFFIIS